MFDERKQLILKAIIDNYISNAEPIGSRTISKKYNLGVSSATIRNEMSDLEEMGYLEQPHTSSGRIPSDKGYRFYVDYLMRAKKLTGLEKNNIKKVFEKRIIAIEEIIEETARILSQMTNYTSIVLGPELRQSILKHLQIVPIDKRKALVIIVTNSGMVEHRFIKITDSLNESDLTRVSNIMNDRLSGRSFDEITPSLIRDIEKEIFGCDELLNVTMNILFQSLSGNQNANKIVLGGTSNIFSQPEYKDLDKAKEFLTLLDEKKLLKEILRSSILNNELVITIGSENKFKEIKNCSVITATYSVNGKTMGSIGVLGPTRMEYPKVITVVTHITEALNKILTKNFNNN